MSFERLNESELHEFGVIDAIVRGGGDARPEDAALTDFALLVRNARPVPNHGEAAALDARAEAALSGPKKRERLIFKPAFAGVCALVLMAGVTGVAYLSSSSQSGDHSMTPPPMLGPMESGPAVGESADSAGTSSPGASNPGAKSEKAMSVAPAMPGVTSPTIPREVARDTRLTLAADGADIERLSDRVNAIVDRHGGYVASSKVRGGEGNRGRATFDLMIPAAQYKPALAAISRLAHVRSRSQSSQDITTEVNSAERAVKRWTARVNRLEDQLAAAETTQQRVILRRQLASASAAKREATRQVRANRARVNYVPIALTIVADKTAADKDKGAITKAFDKAGKILTAIAAVLIVALAVLIPIALIVAALWFGVRRWHRARSNRAIDAAAAAQPE
ncbi:MAG: DUF4349 domain-containing protein [Thermoleophilaceae bacterium]|nr:DUF4349 domain-containing protein [Thermoleophilaceae bacterium]